MLPPAITPLPRIGATASIVFARMGRTLLIGSTSHSWREWLKENRAKRDYLCLDPSEPSQAPPGRLALHRGDKVVAWRFYGSLDAQRSPHVLLAALAQFLRELPTDAIVQTYPYRSTPLIRHLTMLVAQLVDPAEILVPVGSGIVEAGFPVGPHEVELEPAFPAMVQQAQRKAQWLRLLEQCSDHEVDLQQTGIEGARFGSGRALSKEELSQLNIPGALYAETGGGTLLAVAPEEPSENTIARALDLVHCSRASIASEGDFQGLLCSFARQSGEDFGMGMIEAVDFVRMQARIRCTAVPPAPVRLLRIGSLRVSPTGAELGETRPWQV